MDTVLELLTKQQRHSLHGESPAPLYYQLYSLLKTAILNGTVSNGAQMPTEQQLAEAFDVSRITAKRAMDELAAEALVERRRGKGTHVIHEYKPKPVKAPLVGMLQELESMGRQTSVKVLLCEKKVPPTHIRELMQIPEGENVYHMIRVRSKDGEPFGYYTSWTQGLTSRITASQVKKKTRLELFREQGINLTHVTQTISAVAADEELARELKTEVGAPLISLTRHSYSGTDPEVLVDYMQLYYHPDRFQYRMDLELEE